ncbi:MAG: phosphoribosylglycinamide formyltransferase [Chloroflexota bacterium]
MPDDRGGAAPMRLGWLSTGRGTGSRGLLEATLHAIDARKLNASFEFVFMNRVRGEGEGSDAFMDLVEGRGIPLVRLSSRQFRREHDRRPWSELRNEYDRAALELLEPYNPDICVAAGYMLIAPLLCRHFTILNLHPALPGGPIGMWDRVIWELIERGAEETGNMINVVTEEVDGGPVVSYCRFPIRGERFDPLWEQLAGRSVADLQAEEAQELPLFREIRAAGVERERPLLVATLAAVAEGRIDPKAARTEDALDMTGEVERMVAADG